MVSLFIDDDAYKVFNNSPDDIVGLVQTHNICIINYICRKVMDN